MSDQETPDDKTPQLKKPTRAGKGVSLALSGALVATGAGFGTELGYFAAKNAAQTQFDNEHPYPTAVVDNLTSFDIPHLQAIAAVKALDGAKVKDERDIEDMMLAYFLGYTEASRPTKKTEPVSADQTRIDHELRITRAMGVNAAVKSGLNSSNQADRQLVEKMVETYTLTMDKAIAEQANLREQMEQTASALQKEWGEAKRKAVSDTGKGGTMAIGALIGAVGGLIALYLQNRSDRRQKIESSQSMAR